MIELTIDRREKEFFPGDTVPLNIRWEFDSPQESIDVHLFWHTVGKGTEDLQIVWEEAIPTVGRSGRKQLDIPLPDQPYSFSGNLISLVWSIDAVSEPEEEVSSIDIVVSPTRSEISLLEIAMDARDDSPRR